MRSLGAVVIGDCVLPSVDAENSGPLEKQQVFLSAEPSL